MDNFFKISGIIPLEIILTDSKIMLKDKILHSDICHRMVVVGAMHYL